MVANWTGHSVLYPSDCPTVCLFVCMSANFNFAFMFCFFLSVQGTVFLYWVKELHMTSTWPQTWPCECRCQVFHKHVSFTNCWSVSIYCFFTDYTWVLVHCESWSRQWRSTWCAEWAKRIKPTLASCKVCVVFAYYFKHVVTVLNMPCVSRCI